MEPP
ncbi:hypothetical protein CFP56_015558 [Quercus suber]|jgi:WD40-like Beta Propeller Repeat